jgi:uncharacterized protein involved in response to NO
MSTPAALKRRREYASLTLFSYGFRPFFLSSGLWAVISLPLWLHQFYGDITLPTRFAPLDWHVHEMLFGYVAAAITGFLLTAIPNWTGRLPMNGWPLAGLAAFWLAGRVAIFFSAKIGGALAAAIDISFLLTLTAVVAREIISGKNWRNLRVLGVLVALALGNIVFHAEVLIHGAANYGTRMGLAAVILLISLIGGRIVPSFTNNWLARNNPGRLPVPFSRYDMSAIAAGAVGMVAWIAAPTDQITGGLLFFAGLLHTGRVARWAGDRALADRLVLVLHVAYAFVPFGFLLVGLSTFTPAILPTAGIHAWTAGAIGLMTLAVMTRATLGHTAQPLQAGIATQFIYGLIFVSAVLRVIAALTGSIDLIESSAVCWLLGFALFVVVYGRLLILRKPAWADARC